MVFILLLFIISITDSKWVTIYHPPLPRYSYTMAAGSYNGSIFILGGGIPGLDSYTQQLLEYRDDIWIDHGEYALPSDTYGFGDYYTQINDSLYMTVLGNTLNVYNMNTNIFIRDWINVPNHDMFMSCITSTYNTLFIMGGYKNELINTVSVLLLDTMEWLNNVPNMQIKRVGHSCNIDPDTSSLYAIGGSGSYWSRFNTVEMINIDNITQETWHFLQDTLSLSGTGFRSIWINNKIYVFGDGYVVNVINPNTQTISLVTDILPISGYTCAVTVMDNIIYLFNAKEYWAMNSNITSQSSRTPTKTPTIRPTFGYMWLTTTSNEYVSITLDTIMDNAYASQSEASKPITLYIIVSISSVVVIVFLLMIVANKKNLKNNNNDNDVEANDIDEIETVETKTDNVTAPFCQDVGMEKTDNQIEVQGLY